MSDGNMPEAKCPKCGTQHFGWALLNPKHQICKKCGAQLEMVNKGSRGLSSSPGRVKNPSRVLPLA